MGAQQRQSNAAKQTEATMVARMLRLKAERAAATRIHTWLDRTGRTCRLVFVDTHRVPQIGVDVNGQTRYQTVRPYAYVARQRDDGDGWDRKRVGTTAALRLLAEDARSSQQRVKHSTSKGR